MVITAPRDLRSSRANVPLEARERRLLPDEEKVKRADYSYSNVGTLEELDAWVEALMQMLLEEGERGEA